MPTSSARRRHSLSLVKLAALHGINQPAVAHSRLNSSTWSPPHQQDNHVSCLTAWRGVSGVHNKSLSLLGSLMPGGFYLAGFSLFRKECFSSFPISDSRSSSLPFQRFLLTEKNYDAAFCSLAASVHHRLSKMMAWASR